MVDQIPDNIFQKVQQLLLKYYGADDAQDDFENGQDAGAFQF